MPPDTTAVAANWKRESFVARDSRPDIIGPLLAGCKENEQRGSECVSFSSGGGAPTTVDTQYANRRRPRPLKIFRESVEPWTRGGIILVAGDAREAVGLCNQVPVYETSSLWRYRTESQQRRSQDQKVNII